MEIGLRSYSVEKGNNITIMIDLFNIGELPANVTVEIATAGFGASNDYIILGSSHDVISFTVIANPAVAGLYHVPVKLIFNSVILSTIEVEITVNIATTTTTTTTEMTSTTTILTDFHVDNTVIIIVVISGLVSLIIVLAVVFKLKSKSAIVD
jgi:hypothetical protein